jgi:hypothetical protein
VSKYVDAIQASKEDQKKQLAPALAQEQKAQLGLTIKRLELDIQTAETSVASMKSQYPLDISAIIDAGDEVDLKKRQLAQLIALDSELF